MFEPYMAFDLTTSDVFPVTAILQVAKFEWDADMHVVKEMSPEVRSRDMEDCITHAEKHALLFAPGADPQDQRANLDAFRRLRLEVHLYICATTSSPYRTKWLDVSSAALDRAWRRYLHSRKLM